MELVKWIDLSSKQRKAVDEFIMKGTTNGEFINSPKYLSYHQEGRFKDDSVVILDISSKTIRAVLMAAHKYDNENVIISHPGTTFAGPVIDRKLRIEMIEEVLDMMLSYYESKYEKIELKLSPTYYSFQSCNVIDYFLLKRGYTFGMTGLANIVNISDIDTEEDILNLFSSKRRNQVRKVIKEDYFEFKEEELIKLSVWDNMNKNLSVKFSSKTTHTWDEICDLKSKYKDNIRLFYVNTKDGLYGAFGLIYMFKNVFHTQYLDLNYDYSGKYPNLFLIMKLIKKARESGYDYFSFGASTEDGGKILNYGLYNYKAEYGGGDIILPLYTKMISNNVMKKK